MKKMLLSISILWLGSLLGAGFVFLTQLVLARKLGPTDFGVFSAIFSIVSLLVPLASFGVAQYWLKEFGKHGWAARRFISPSLKLIVATTFFAIFTIILWGLIGPHDTLMKYAIMIMALYVAGQVVIELVAAKFQLEERYSMLAFWQITPHLIRFLMVVALVFFASEWLSVLNVVIIFALISIALLMLSVSPLHQLSLGKLALKGHENTLQFKDKFIAISPINIMQRAWPFGLAGLFHLIYFQSDIILVKYITGNEAAGLYNVAFMIMVMVLLFPSIVYQKFLLPKIHRWANHDRAMFYKVYKQGNIVMLGLGLLAMLIVWWLAPYAVPILFGEHYQQSIDLLWILAWSIPILFVASSVGSTLVTQENMKIKVKLMGLVAVINIALNLWLIPLYGASGAAVATVVSNLLLLFSYYIASISVFNYSKSGNGEK